VIHRPALVVGSLALSLLAGCATQPASQPARTVTVTRSAPTTSASTSVAPTTSATASGTASGTPAALPPDCDAALPLPAVITALGRGVPGLTAFVVGQPEADIGRLAYLNCRYGLPADGKGTPAIEIGVSLYKDNATAAARVPATVADYTAHGATATSTTVAGQQASVLTGGSGTGYTSPTIVVASGQRTVAVSIAEQDNATADLVKLATLALQNTGG
jgi:hypothetical protein